MKSRSSFLPFLFLLMYLIIGLQGFVDFGSKVIVLFVIWLFLSLLFGPKGYRDIYVSKRAFSLYFFILFVFLSDVMIQPLSTSINRAAELIYVVSPVFIIEYLNYSCKKYRIIVFVVASIVIIANIYLSYRFQNITGVSDLRQAGAYGGEYYIALVSFRWVSGVSLLVPALFDVALKKRNVSQQKVPIVFILYALVAFLIYFLMGAQYTIPLLLAIIGVVGCFVIKTEKVVDLIKKRLLRTAVIGGVFFLVFINVLPAITRYLENQDGFGQLAYHFQELEHFFLGNKVDASDMNLRGDLATKSFETFLLHPIFGVNHKVLTLSQLKIMGVGNHSQWLDDLALYGIFSFFLFSFLYKSLKLQKERSGSIITMIMFIALGFLNPLWFFPQLFMTFVYIPLLYTIILDRT